MLVARGEWPDGGDGVSRGGGATSGTLGDDGADGDVGALTRRGGGGQKVSGLRGKIESHNGTPPQNVRM